MFGREFGINRAHELDNPLADPLSGEEFEPSSYCEIMSPE